MASSSLLLLITVATLLVTAIAQTAAPAPSPPAKLNLTGILTKGSQFTTLLRLLRDTQVLVQLDSQLNNSFNGMTIFAPTDNAFSNLKPGTLNSLSNPEQVELLQFHVLPRFYTFDNFQTASNPLQTQGSSSDGSDTLNVTSSGNNQVNITTGVVTVQANNALYSTFPLVVYPVDKVLLPNSLFGAKAPSKAPAPASADKPGKKGPVVASSSDGPSSDEAANSNSGVGLKGFGWSVVVGVVLGFLCV